MSNNMIKTNFNLLYIIAQEQRVVEKLYSFSLEI